MIGRGGAALVLIAAVLGAAPVAAQVKGIAEKEGSELAPGTELTWEISLNPSFGNKLDISDDRITNENTVSGEIGVEHVLPGGTYLSAVGGIEANPEFASTIRLPGAAAFGQVQLGQRILLGSNENLADNRDVLDLSASYKLQRGYEDDDDVTTDDDYLDHQFGGEVSFKNIVFLRRKTPGAELEEGIAYELTGGWARVESDQRGREKSALTATGELTLPFYKLPDFNLQAGYERSRYDERVGGERRRDHTYTLFGGLDLKKYLPERTRVGELSAGLKFSHNASTIDEEDDTSLELQLVLKFGNG